MSRYLDHAATSFPKPESVYRAVDSALRQAGNPGRTMSGPGRAAFNILENAREKIASFFGVADQRCVIFTLNCTDSLNMALKGLLESGDTVVTDPYPHNAVARPLLSAAASGVKVRTCRPLGSFGLDLEDFERQCRDGLKLAVITHVSNVTGRAVQLPEITKIVHRYGGLLLLDAAQSAGALPIDMETMEIDLMAAPGHKGLLGPAGCGILLMRRDIPVRPFREGGTGFLSQGLEMPAGLPYRLESGTAPVSAIAGLAAGITYLTEQATPMGKNEAALANRLMVELQQISGIQLYSSPTSSTGVVLFNLADREPVMVAGLLDTAYGIAVRAGLHCAHRAHETIGTLPRGAIRVSFGWNSTAEDVDALLGAVEEIASY